VFRKRLKISPAFGWFFVLAYVISVFWFAPVARDMIEWIHQATYSDFNPSGQVGPSKAHFLRRVADYGCWPIAALLFVLGTLQFIFLTGQLKPWLKRLLFISPVIFVPPVLGSFTTNGDPKEYLLGDLIALLSGVIFFAAPKFKLSWVRTVILVAMAALLLDYKIDFLRGRRDPVGTLIEAQSWQLRAPAGQDALDGDFIAFTKFLPHRPASPALHICILQMQHFNDLDWVADPFALKMMSQEMGEHWNFDRPSTRIFPTTAERYEWVKKNCDYLLALPLEHKPAPPEHFATDLGELVYTAWKQNRLKQEGLVLVSRDFYRGNDQSTGEFILLRPANKISSAAAR
jgi:hypothetical protein